MLDQAEPQPDTTLPRIIFGLWLLASLVFTTAYRSILVDRMTFPIYEQQPATFNDLARSDYEIGMEGSSIGSSIHNFFLHSPNPLFQQIYRRIKPVSDSRQCFERALASNFACLMFRGQGSYFIYRNYSTRNGMTHLKIAPDYAARAMPGIAMKKRSVYTKNFDRVINPIVEMGIVMKWIKMDHADQRSKYLVWAKQANVTIQSQADGPCALVLEHLKGPFLFLLLGTSIGFVIFAWDFTFKAVITSDIVSTTLETENNCQVDNSSLGCQSID